MYCTITPTMIGTVIPAKVPVKFIIPVRNPTLFLVAKLGGTEKKRPHQRMKNNVQESSTTTATPLRVYATAKIETVPIMAAVPKIVRITTLGLAPVLRHLSETQPPVISPKKPQRNAMKVAPPIFQILKPWTLLR